MPRQPHQHIGDRAQQLIRSPKRKLMHPKDIWPSCSLPLSIAPVVIQFSAASLTAAILSGIAEPRPEGVQVKVPCQESVERTVTRLMALLAGVPFCLPLGNPLKALRFDHRSAARTILESTSGFLGAFESMASSHLLEALNNPNGLKHHDQGPITAWMAVVDHTLYLSAGPWLRMGALKVQLPDLAQPHAVTLEWDRGTYYPVNVDWDHHLSSFIANHADASTFVWRTPVLWSPPRQEKPLEESFASLMLDPVYRYLHTVPMPGAMGLQKRSMIVNFGYHRDGPYDRFRAISTPLARMDMVLACVRADRNKEEAMFRAWSERGQDMARQPSSLDAPPVAQLTASRQSSLLFNLAARFQLEEKLISTLVYLEQPFREGQLVPSFDELMPEEECCYVLQSNDVDLAWHEALGHKNSLSRMLKRDDQGSMGHLITWLDDLGIQDGIQRYRMSLLASDQAFVSHGSLFMSQEISAPLTQQHQPPMPESFRVTGPLVVSFVPDQRQLSDVVVGNNCLTIEIGNMLPRGKLARTLDEMQTIHEPFWHAMHVFANPPLPST